MNSRKLLMVAALAAVCISASVAGDALPTPSPIGVWSLSVDDGSTVTLTIDENTISIKGVMPVKGTTTMTAPCYDLRDGVLFGYFEKLEWSDGVNSNDYQGILPFAFRVSLDGDTLKVRDLKMYGADAKAHAAMSGSYHRKK
jgi:hypothetical protein